MNKECHFIKSSQLTGEYFIVEKDISLDSIHIGLYDSELFVLEPERFAELIEQFSWVLNHDLISCGTYVLYY